MQFPSCSPRIRRQKKKGLAFGELLDLGISLCRIHRRKGGEGGGRGGGLANRKAGASPLMVPDWPKESLLPQLNQANGRKAKGGFTTRIRGQGNAKARAS